jgi:hypothetical protein
MTQGSYILPKLPTFGDKYTLSTTTKLERFDDSCSTPKVPRLGSSSVLKQFGTEKDREAGTLFDSIRAGRAGEKEDSIGKVMRLHWKQH